MSASLVGSEMCIRDSTTHHIEHTPPAHPSTHAGQGGVQGSIRGCEEEAVSYTHLTLPTICSV
eukprot:6288400-Alexandrium_andersonii.AAC.1